MSQSDNSGLLGSFRVLDLTDETGFFTGKVLDDLGADVIKIEKPGGDSSRNAGPFYHNEPHPEKSLNWFAYNINKRGITLDVHTADGQQLFKRLAEKADFVIESSPVGYLDSLGLGYRQLSAINPRLVMTSVTPFGQTGPYKDFKASDVIAMAMGGFLYLTGSPDGPPARMSLPLAYVWAGAYGAAATMIAHYHRETTGKGQHVDVSMQACIALGLANAIPVYQMTGTIIKRSGAFLVGRGSKVKSRLLWPCRDGYIVFVVIGGLLGGRSNRVVAKWIEEEGTASEFLRSMNWEFDMASQTQDIQDRIENEFAGYFARHTKAELYDKAREAGIMLVPLAMVKDIMENPQLKARDYWMPVQHPELKDTITYPGAFIKASKTPIAFQRRAPLIGEHNAEIYGPELGLSGEDIRMLKESGTI